MEVIAPAAPLTIDEPSQVPAARRAASRLAETLGFDAVGAGNVALVVTEIGTNILKHGGGGQILLITVRQGDVDGIEIVGLDRGQGIADVGRSLRDGYSTAGSPGTGLGAIRRLSSAFDIYAAPGQGTAVLARLWPRRPAPQPHRLVVGAAAAAHAGEDVSGDAWAMEQTATRTVLLLVDGLGHGVVAAEAARQAVRVFRANAGDTPRGIVQALHEGLRSTRGAAAAVTEIDPDRGLVKFSGVGNICAAIFTPGGRRHLVSHNGTAGLAARKIDEFSYPWSPETVLVEHTDGLATHWDVARYPSLLGRSPSLIAGVLYRDWTRGRDDVTVIAAREMPA
ncbi:MAG TPA: ATP-binding SpoIIE family protein phosphatase [Candidatus Acidoferrum sp.]|nr:ATP-binding SpoIIE family protein phosphatase [Candidatus Acidoferrum sp.]